MSRKREKIEGTFTIYSFEKIGTIEQDRDVGVLRVCGSMLARLGGRNALVRITIVMDEEPSCSLIRIVRAATGKGALQVSELALQYDDRQTLGVCSAGDEHSVILEPVGRWLGLPLFLLGHTSPLVRLQAIFGIVLMCVGLVVGLIAGGLFGGLLEALTRLWNMSDMVVGSIRALF